MNEYYNSLILCLFLGTFGVHRFYTGYKRIGLIQLLLTLSIIGFPISCIWVFADLLKIVCKKYKTSNGMILTDNKKIKKNDFYTSLNFASYEETKKASEFLKKATELKSTDINKSIEYLKKAYTEISKTEVFYPIETFLRLPLYLQSANRQEEALNEFNNLLKNGYPNQMKVKELIYMDESQVYDKMRLFWQREKQPIKAISYGIYSILLGCLGLYFQKRESELENFKNINFIKEKLLSILKKAKKIDCSEIVSNIVFNEINKIPQILSFEEIEKIINQELDI